jgi:hypothetical protein
MADELSVRFKGPEDCDLFTILVGNAFRRALALETRLPPTS